MSYPEKKVNMFRNKIVCWTILIGIMGSVLLGVLFSCLTDFFYVNWFLSSVFFFLIIESFSILYVEKKSHKVDSKKLVNTYMLSKLVKILLSLSFVTVYAIAVKENIKHFVLQFISLYFLFLAIEVYMFIKIEKHLKKNNNEE